MESIFSIATMQRILDHWGVGQIEDVTYFEKVGSSVWRHYVETSQGNFELFSYPDADSSAQATLQAALAKRSGVLEPSRVHSFDHYHELLRLSKKYEISRSQAENDVFSLRKKKIDRAFRVFGTIFQIHLDDESVLVSYGRWNISRDVSGNFEVLADTDTSSKDQLDATIEALEELHPTLESWEFTDQGVSLFMSEGFQLSFAPAGKFAAIEIQVFGRQNRLFIFSQDRIFSSTEC